MKLIDLLSILSEYHDAIVEDYKGIELGRYDGKDSIPLELNNKSVLNVYPHGGATHIVVETRW